jgi:hypothetical protein
MVQLAIRCQPRASTSVDELEGWLELEIHELRAAVPRSTVRLSRLAHRGPAADSEAGWLIELQLAEGEPLLGEDRLTGVLRDMRLLGLEPTVLTADASQNEELRERREPSASRARLASGAAR